MPFVQQDPKPFTEHAVLALRKNLNGVYGIYRRDAWIYVGKGDIRKRLFDHFTGDIPCIIRQRPSNWVAEVISGDPSQRERELILELNSICNQRIG
jgi:hypothetical protein